MFYLITGSIGAGKTLQTVELLSHIQDRPIFYNNLVLTEQGKDRLTNWVELTADDITEMKTFRSKEDWAVKYGSAVILLDECHKVFPVRGATSAAPPWIEALAEHRHVGIDFYLITQHPKDLDVFIRRRLFQYIHYTRQFGSEAATSFTWQGYVEGAPDDYHAKQKAQKSRKNYPKHVYGWYVSTIDNTVKRKFPKVLFLIPVLVLLVIGLFWWVFDTMSHGGGAGNSTPVVSSVSSVSSSSATPSPVTVLLPSPRKRPLYEQPLTSLIPPYVLSAKKVYLESSTLFGDYAMTTYKMFQGDEDNEGVLVTSKVLLAAGARIRVIDHCVNIISFPDFDLWTQCPPQPTDKGELPSDNSPSELGTKPLNPEPLAQPLPF